MLRSLRARPLAALQLPRLSLLSAVRLYASRPPALEKFPARGSSSSRAAPSRGTPAKGATGKERAAPRQEERQRANGEGYTDSYQLSDRVKKLAGRGELDAAVELVKGSSAGAGDNVIVWNGLIHATLLERKFKRAYELWMDMKRRGMTPTTRSYSTFFGGYAKMKEIDSAALARVKTIYAQWVLYSEKMAYKAANKRSIMERGEAPEEISCIPTNAYLTFLGNTKNIPLMLETLGKMPTAGVLAPNSLTYSIVLAALRASNEPENFAYAMELWQKMSAETLDIDTKTVSIVISICREAQRPDDQKIGLEVAKEFYGFVNPEEEDLLVSPKLAPPRVVLDGTAMSNVMSLALGMQQYNLTARWFDQVRDNPKRFGYDVLEHYHCDLVLVALAVKKDPEAAEDLVQWMLRSSSSLKPTLQTFTNAIQVCWRSADLPRATRFLSLMSGKQIGTLAPPVAPTSKATPLTFQPDERIISTMLQTALATKDRGDIARTIDVVDSFGFGKDFFLTATPAPSTPTSRAAPVEGEEEEAPVSPSHPVKNAASYRQFWTYKMGEVFERSLERVLQSRESLIEPERRRELTVWRANVVQWLEAQEVKPEAKLGEESMKGRRQIVKEKEASRKMLHSVQKEINETRRAKEESQDPYRSDEARRSKSLSASRDGEGFRSRDENEDSGGRAPRRQYGGGDALPFQDPPRRREAPYAPAPDSAEDRAKWQAASISDWPTRQVPSKPRAPPSDRPRPSSYDSERSAQRPNFSRDRESSGFSSRDRASPGMGRNRDGGASGGASGESRGSRDFGGSSREFRPREERSSRERSPSRW